jgi:hypothetical protein
MATKAQKNGPVSSTKPAPAVEATPASPPLQAVPARSEAQQKWDAIERTQRARKMGVSVEALAEIENPTEDWQDDLGTAREPAGAEYAGLYHLKHGHLGVPRLSPDPILAGRKVRLTADEGRCATESGVGGRIGG